MHPAWLDLVSSQAQTQANRGQKSKVDDDPVDKEMVVRREPMFEKGESVLFAAEAAFGTSSGILGLALVKALLPSALVEA